MTLHPPRAAGTQARAVWGDGVPACCPGVVSQSVSACGFQGREHCDIGLCHNSGSRGGSLGPKHHKTVQPLARVRWELCSLSQPWGCWQGVVVRAVALASCTGLGDKECGGDWDWDSQSFLHLGHWK